MRQGKPTTTHTTSFRAAPVSAGPDRLPDAARAERAKYKDRLFQAKAAAAAPEGKKIGDADDLTIESIGLGSLKFTG